jgi:hypothetical protein
MFNAAQTQNSVRKHSPGSCESPVPVRVEISGIPCQAIDKRDLTGKFLSNSEISALLKHKPLRDGGESFNQRRNDTDLQSKAFSLFGAHPEFCDELLRSLVCLGGDHCE